MPKRVHRVLLSLLTLTLLTLGPPALATEGGEPVGVPDGAQADEGEGQPSIDSVGQDNEVARSFFPEEYEEPTVFPWIKYGLTAAALVLSFLLLLLFLKWQPQFARERRAKARSRR